MIELEDLEELIDDLAFDHPCDNHLDLLYTTFTTHFAAETLKVDGVQLKINKAPYSKVPFRGKMETFVHIITRENKLKGKREFDRERANRIHWVRPILTYSNLVAIKVFRRQHANRQWQQFFWYEEKNFVVIVREIQPHFLLITAYCVDKSNKSQFKRWYQEFKK